MKVGDLIYIDWVDNWGIMHVGDTAVVTALIGQRKCDEFTAVVKRVEVEVSGWWDEEINSYKGCWVHPSLKEI